MKETMLKSYSQCQFIEEERNSNFMERLRAKEAIIKGETFEIWLKSPLVSVDTSGGEKKYVLVPEAERIIRKQTEPKELSIDETLKQLNSLLLELIFTLKSKRGE